jgi:hypothetical protein
MAAPEERFLRGGHSGCIYKEGIPMTIGDIATLYQYAVDACHGPGSRFYRMQGTLSRALMRHGWGRDGRYSTVARRRTKLYRSLSERYGVNERPGRARPPATTYSLYDDGFRGHDY